MGSSDPPESTSAAPRILFRVLGPLEVIIDGHTVSIPAAKQRVILAALLMRANRPVSVAELSERLWDGAQPADARGTIQKYIMRLRRLLATGGGAAMVCTQPDGYRMTVPPGHLDLDQFVELIRHAGRAAETAQPEAERAALRAATQLWRAVPPLSDVPSTSLHTHEVAGLLEQYLHALDRRIELDLRAGRHAELLPELTGLVREHPHRERFWAHLMRALYRSGRQAEALTCYRDVRRFLADDLGIDPGHDLHAAHHEILGVAAASGPDTSARPAIDRAPHGKAHAVPRLVRQLPRNVVGFVGRQPEFAAVVAAASTAPILITGSPGMGKSGLAVRAALQLSPRYPDGQLYIDLNGTASTGAPPMGPVLDGVLRSFGVPADTVPVGDHGHITAYRSMLAGRRVLIVIDGASTAAQVRPLIPGTAGCGVIVTSRWGIPGLIVTPGARSITLKALSRAQAYQLLVFLLGVDRVEADRAATRQLLGMCGGLPLAIRTVAADLTQQTGVSVAHYVQHLSQNGLDPASGEDTFTELFTAFAHTLDHLRPVTRRVLQMVSEIPPMELTAPVIGKLAGIGERDAASALEVLIAVGLAERLSERSCRLTGLIRHYLLHAAQESGLRAGHGATGARITSLAQRRSSLPATAIDAC